MTNHRSSVQPSVPVSSRRTFLRTIGATATTLSGATASASAAGTDYETITLSPGETKRVEVHGGETLENKLYDVRADGAGVYLHTFGDDWTVRNVAYRGANATNGIAYRGSGTFENVYLGDGTEADADTIGMITVADQSTGPIILRNVHIADWNTGIYGSPTGEQEGPITRIYDSYFDTNTGSQIKIGSPLGPCEVVNTTVRTDGEVDKGRSGSTNVRAVWALDHNGGGPNHRNTSVFRDCDLQGLIAATCGAVVELENTRWDGQFNSTEDVHGCYPDVTADLHGESVGDPDLSPPAGVPMTAEEAASGTGSPSSPPATPRTSSGSRTESETGSGDSPSGRQTSDDLPHKIVIDGSTAQNPSSYEIRVSGTIAKAASGQSEITDSVSGKTATGVVEAGGQDLYRFSGEITDQSVDGTAAIRVERATTPGEQTEAEMTPSESQDLQTPPAESTTETEATDGSPSSGSPSHEMGLGDAFETLLGGDSSNQVTDAEANAVISILRALLFT